MVHPTLYVTEKGSLRDLSTKAGLGMATPDKNYCSCLYVAKDKCRTWRCQWRSKQKNEVTDLYDYCPVRTRVWFSFSFFSCLSSFAVVRPLSHMRAVFEHL